MLQLREVRKAPSVWLVGRDVHQKSISMCEVEMPSERLQKLKEIGMVEYICLLLAHWESRPFTNQCFKRVICKGATQGL